MWQLLLAGWLAVFPMISWSATPDWNLKLSVVGGEDATAIDYTIADGKVTLEQQVAGGEAKGLGFTYNGALSLMSYRQTGSSDATLFGLPAGYTDLYLRFDGLTGSLTQDGDASFDTGSGSIALYLDQGGNLAPGTNAITLATFELAPSKGADFDYFDGGGIHAVLDLNLSLVSSIAGLFTELDGTPFGPQSVLALTLYSHLDPSLSPNPSEVPDGTGTSTSQLLLTGEIGATNYGVLASPVPEPANACLILVGLIGVMGLSRKRALRRVCDSQSFR